MKVSTSHPMPWEPMERDELWLQLCRMDAKDVWKAYEFLERVAIPKLAADHPLRSEVIDPERDLPDGMDTPDARAMRMFIWRFMQLPGQERGALLNGWRSWRPQGYDRRELIAEFITNRTCHDVEPVMIASGRNVAGGVSFEISDNEPIPEGLEPVVMMIRPASTREQVLSFLVAAIAAVERDWESLPGISGGSLYTCRSAGNPARRSTQPASSARDVRQEVA